MGTHNLGTHHLGRHTKTRRYWLGSVLAALLTVTVWKLVTGGLHLDGLADTAERLRDGRAVAIVILEGVAEPAVGLVQVVVFLRPPGLERRDHPGRRGLQIDDRQAVVRRGLRLVVRIDLHRGGDLFRPAHSRPFRTDPEDVRRHQQPGAREHLGRARHPRVCPGRAGAAPVREIEPGLHRSESPASEDVGDVEVDHVRQRRLVCFFDRGPQGALGLAVDRLAGAC